MQDSRLSAEEKETHGKRLTDKWKGIKSNKKSREQWEKLKEDTEFKILELETDKAEKMNKLLEDEQDDIARESTRLAKETQALDISDILGRKSRGGKKKEIQKEKVDG